MAMGALTGAYEATRFKNKPPKAHLESLAVLGAGAGAEAAIKRAAALARGNILARCGLGLQGCGGTGSGLCTEQDSRAGREGGLVSTPEAVFCMPTHLMRSRPARLRPDLLC